VTKRSAITPLKLSDAFDGLLIRIGQLSSKADRLIEIGQFIDTYLLPNPTFASSFLLELGDHLPTPSEYSSIFCVSPSDLKKVSDALYWAADIESDPVSSATFNNCATFARIEAICVLVWIGDNSKAEALIRAGSKARVPLKRKSVVDPVKALDEMILIYHPDWQDWWSRSVLNRQTYFERDGSVAFFPAVLRFGVRAHNRKAENARLRRMQFSLLGRTSAHDELQFLTRDTDDSLLAGSSIPPIRAARNLLAGQGVGILKNGYRGVFEFSDDVVGHSGRSAHLALAVLYVIEFLSYTEQRRRFRLKIGTVFTGDISASGDVMEVDSDTLDKKIVAVFFSGASRFVLPLTQLLSARKILSQLDEKYPTRGLSLIGVESLRDVFLNRDITDYICPGPLRYFGERIWRRRISIAAPMILIAIITALLIRQYKKPDMHATRVAALDGGITVFNSSDRIIRRIPLSLNSFNLQLVLQNFGPVLRDINDDGYRDIIWMEEPNYLTGTSGDIRFLSGASGDTLWTIRTEYPMDYPYDISIIHGRMRPFGFTFVDVDSKLKVIITASQTDVYPSVLVSYDVASRKLEQRYDHPGNFNKMILQDLDGDGEPELLVGGGNNSMNTAVIAVFNPSQIDGTAYAEGDYRTSQSARHKELAYIRFPSMDGLIFTPPFSSNVESIQVREIDQLIKVEVSYLVHIPGYQSKEGVLTYYFNYDFKPVSLVTNDRMDEAWERALYDGYIDMPLNNEIKKQLLNLPELWTEHGWVRLSETTVFPAQ